MKICPKCAAECNDYATFCSNCGSYVTQEAIDAANAAQVEPEVEPLVEVVETAAIDEVIDAAPVAPGAKYTEKPVVEDPFVAPAVEAEPVVEAAPAVAAAAPAAAYQPAAQQPAYQPAPVEQPQVAYEPAQPATAQATVEPPASGFAKQAWEDYKGSSGWLPKSLLGGLIMMVPILNFVGEGYAMQWGRRASYRKGDQLPEKFFEDNTFVMGFFAFVLSLIAGLIVGLCGGAPIIALAVTAFLYPFLSLCILRVAIIGRLGAGFELGNIWEKAQRNWKGGMGAYWFPMLIAAAAAVVIVLILCGSTGISILAFSSDTALGYGLGFFGVLMWLVGFYVVCVVSFASTCIAYRAIGYWIARFAPEWVQESYNLGTQPE